MTRLSFLNSIISNSKNNSLSLALAGFIEKRFHFGFGQKEYNVKILKNKDLNTFRFKEENQPITRWTIAINCLFVTTLGIPALALKATLRLWNFKTLWPDAGTPEKTHRIGSSELIDKAQYKESIQPEAIEEVIDSVTLEYTLLYHHMEFLNKHSYISQYPAEFLNKWSFLDKSITSLKDTIKLIKKQIDPKFDSLKLQIDQLEKNVADLDENLQNQLTHNAKVLSAAFDAKDAELQQKVDYNLSDPAELRQSNLHNSFEFELRRHSTLLQANEKLQGKPNIPQEWPKDIAAVLKQNDENYQEQRLAVPKTAPKGIPNILNSCYMNSVLQVMLNSEHFRQIIIDAHAKPQQNPQKRNIVNALHHFMEVVDNQPEKIRVAAISLRTAIFKSEIGDFNHTSDISDQMDAGSLFELFAEVLDYQIPLYDEYVPSDSKAIGYKIKEESRPEKLLRITALPNSNNGKQEVQKLVDQMFLPKKEDVPRTFEFIDHTGKPYDKMLPNNQNTSLNYDKLPSTLMMHLNRIVTTSTGRSIKIHDPFEFPDNDIIDFSKALKSNGEINQTSKYQITGFVQHLGLSGSGGHYISWVKRDGQWYQCDDSRVVVPTKAEVERAKSLAYLFTLERV